LDERQWVDQFITPFADGQAGPGDDASVAVLADGVRLVTTVDQLVDGTHFRSPWLTDEDLARRAIHVSVSDLAAMGAEGLGVLLALTSPELPGRFGEAYWRGVRDSLTELNMTLLGGNITRSETISIAVTAVGTVSDDSALLRSGARPGDGLWVSGSPGVAGLGLADLLADKESSEAEHWRRPVARLSLGQHLATELEATAAIDLSDGLGVDLSRMLDASGVGAKIELSPLVTQHPRLDAQTVLAGGEEYELLFTLPAGAQAPSDETVTLTHLGTITAEKRLALTVDEEPITLALGGWDPFED